MEEEDNGFTKDYFAQCKKCFFKESIKIASHLKEPSYFKCSKCQEINYNDDNDNNSNSAALPSSMMDNDN